MDISRSTLLTKKQWLVASERLTMHNNEKSSADDEHQVFSGLRYGEPLENPCSWYLAGGYSGADGDAVL